MRVVNGFVCQSGCDVALAKKGIDPKNPHNDPVKARQLEEQRALTGGIRTELSGVADHIVPPVSFAGRLEGLNARRGGDLPWPAQLVDRLA